MGAKDETTSSTDVMGEAIAFRIEYEIRHLGLERAFGVSYLAGSRAVRLHFRDDGATVNDGIEFGVRAGAAARVIEYLREYARRRSRR